jgi:hypothetical protein
MADTDPNEFTEREKFIVSYHRARDLSGVRRRFGYDLTIAIASIGCVVFATVYENVALGFVGYALLLGRLYYMVTEGGRWTKDFQNIFAKYDAKLKALSDAQKKQGIRDETR